MPNRNIREHNKPGWGFHFGSSPERPRPCRVCGETVNAYFSNAIGGLPDTETSDAIIICRGCVDRPEVATLAGLAAQAAMQSYEQRLSRVGLSLLLNAFACHAEGEGNIESAEAARSMAKHVERQIHTGDGRPRG